MESNRMDSRVYATVSVILATSITAENAIVLETTR